MVLEDNDPLCCCEYTNVQGERAHLCSLFCDCQELDDTFDRLIMRAKIPEKRCEAILGVIEDRLRIPWPRGAIKVPIDSVTPLVLVPGMFIFASQSWLTQVLVHGMVLPLLIFCKYQTCLRSYRPQTKFFAMWSLATFAFLFYIYQFHVVGILYWPRTVSPIENLILIGFVMGAMYSVYKLKSYDHHYQVLQQQQSDSFNGSNQTPILPKRFCKICLTNIIGKDHHCVWLDVCISEDNFPYFLSFLACIFMSLVLSGLIFLTSICLPLREIGPVLIPDLMCLRWNTHFEGNPKLTFTAGIHCFLLAIPILLLFIVKGAPYLVRTILKRYRSSGSKIQNQRL